MIRGISFEVPQATTNTLWELLGGINIEEFNWYNIASQDEIWNDKKDMAFFKHDHYCGEDFASLIRQDHYVISIKLQAYKGLDEFYEIHTYEEFQESCCQLIVLIYDCEYVEIYSKNNEWVETLYINAMLNRYSNIERITDTNDKRTKMDIR